MATKKKKAAKKAKELTDADVFKIFRVCEENRSLRAFISGQRKVNGRLYLAIDKIGESLKAARAGNEKKHNNCLDEACAINDTVPGVPPGCNAGGVGGGNP
jgi:hypothetical protein